MNVFLTNQFLITKMPCKRAEIRCPIPTQNQDENNQQREQRKRKMIRFNPPYSLNVKTTVGNLFLKLLDHHFPELINFIKYLTTTQ